TTANGTKKETSPIESDALHSLRNCTTSTSAPAWKVRRIPAKEPRKPSQVGTARWNALPTTTPASSSISATERPISTEMVEATRTVPASRAAIAMSLIPLPPFQGGLGAEAISGDAAVQCASLIALRAKQL